MRLTIEKWKVLVVCLPSTSWNDHQIITNTSIVNSVERLNKIMGIPNRVYEETLVETEVKIGQKLYHIESKITSLLDAYEDVAVRNQSRLVVIRGESGTGKTTLVNHLQQLIKDQTFGLLSGYWLDGSFDLSDRIFSPDCPFLTPVNDFLRNVKGDDRVHVGEVLLELLIAYRDSEEMNDIVGWVPELKQIANLSDIVCNSETNITGTLWGSVDEYCTLWNNALEYRNRFQWQFKTLLQAIASALKTKSKPLVLVFRNVHWADETELEFIFELSRSFSSSSSSASNVLFILTFDDNNEQPNNDIAPDHLKKIGIPLLNKYKSCMVTIQLDNMTVDQLNEIVSDCFHTSLDQSRNLSINIWNQTKGNYFLSWSFLQYLARSNQLKTSLADQMFKVQIVGDCCENDNLVVSRLKMFKFYETIEQTQQDLRILSCLGPSFHKDVVSYLVSKESVDDAINNRLLTFDPSGESFKFTHCKIQELVYESILSEKTTRDNYHYMIGRTLLEKINLSTQIDSFVLIIVRQLLLGRQYIKDQQESIVVAKLCQTAGVRVAHTSAFQQALMHFEDGISLLDSRSWRDEYELCQQLYSAAAECSYCCGQTQSVYIYAEPVIKYSRCVLDTVRVRLMIMSTLGSRSSFDQALDSALGLLNDLGEHISSKPKTIMSTNMLMKRLKWKLSKMSDESILSLPNMQDPIKLAIMQTLNLAFVYAFKKDPVLEAHIGLRMMSLTLKHGVSGLSCLSFAVIGNALCVAGYVDEGYRIGQIGVQLNERFKNRSFLARFSSFYYKGVHCWKKPIHECIRPLLHAYKVGLETGDVEAATICGGISYSLQLDTVPLHVVHQGMQDVWNRTQFVKQEGIWMELKPFWLCVQILMDIPKDDPCYRFCTEGSNDNDISGTPSSEPISGFSSLCLSYLLGEFDNDHALDFINAMRQQRKISSPACASKYFLIEGLFLVAKHRQNGIHKLPRRVKICLNHLRQFATMAPHSYLWQCMILDAEVTSLSSTTTTTTRLRDHVNQFVPKYIGAIELCQQTKNMFGLALGNELLAKRLIECGSSLSEADPYVRAAIAMYREWDAVVKVRHLCTEMTQLGFTNL